MTTFSPSPLSFVVEEAARFRAREKAKEKQREEDEKKLFGDEIDVDAQQPEVVTNGETKKNGADEADEQTPAAKTEDVTMKESIQEEIVEDTRWDWTDSNQVSK